MSHCNNIATSLRSLNRRKATEFDSSEVHSIVDSRLPVAEKIELLRLALPKAWIERVDSATHFASAIRQTFLAESPLLSPLDQVPWGQAAAQIRFADLARWKDALKDSTKNEQQILGDAETLATVENLYRADRRSLFSSRQKLYIFVTGDKVLYEAVQKQEKSLELEGIPVFVRAPSDYLPFVNIHALRDAIEASQLDDVIQEELESVYRALRFAVTALGIQRDRERIFSSNRTSNILGQLNAAWESAVSVLALYSAKYVESGAEKIFENLRRFLDEEETIRVAAAVLEKSVDVLRDGHLVLSLKSAIASWKSARSDSNPPIRRRIQAKVMGLSFPELIPEGFGVNGFMDYILGDAPEQALEDFAKHADRADCQILCACIFTATESWETAAVFADRAHQLSVSTGNSAEAREAGYLHALCCRLSLKTPDEFQKAEELLRQNLLNSRGRHLSLMDKIKDMRDRVELGSLRIAATVLQQLSKADDQNARAHWGITPFVTEKFVENTFLRGLSGISLVLEELEASDLFDTERVEGGDRAPECEEIIRAIKLQALTNLTGAYIFRRLLTHGIDVPLRYFDMERIEQFQSELAAETKAGRPLGAVPRVYNEVLVAILAPAGSGRQRAAAAARATIDNLVRTELRLPLLDQAEFEFLSRALMRLEV